MAQFLKRVKDETAERLREDARNRDNIRKRIEGDPTRAIIGFIEGKFVPFGRSKLTKLAWIPASLALVVSIIAVFVDAVPPTIFAVAAALLALPSCMALIALGRIIADDAHGRGEYTFKEKVAPARRIQAYIVGFVAFALMASFLEQAISLAFFATLAMLYIPVGYCFAIRTMDEIEIALDDLAGDADNTKADAGKAVEPVETAETDADAYRKLLESLSPDQRRLLENPKLKGTHIGKDQ